MLDGVDVLLEGVDVPALLHRQRALRDDGAAVVLVVGEVNRHARDLDAVVEGVLDGVRPLEAGKKCRVKVDDAAGVRLEQRLSDHAHVARHDNVLAARLLERGGDLFVGRLGLGVLGLLHNEHRKAGGLRALDAAHARAARHHKRHLGVERAIGDAVDDGLQVGPAAGDEDADLQRGSRGLIVLDEAADTALAAPVAHR